MTSAEVVDPGHPNFIGPQEADPLSWRRREISRGIDEAYFETQLCDREEQNFNVVARGIPIPEDSKEIVMTDQVKGLLEHVFAFAGIQHPTDIFSQRGGKITARAIRAYEDSRWIDFNQLNAQMSALDPYTDDEIE